MRVVTADGSIELGTVETAPTIGITDYSRRVTDDFGVTTVVPRAYARRMSVMIAVPFDRVDDVQRQLADLRATEATWIADDRFSSLSVRGFYKDFEVTLDSALSLIPLTIEGTVETGSFVDPGGDPAVEGRSSLQLLDPVAVEGGVLVSSSVAETDAPAWAVAASYTQGARVVVAHRVYESLVAGNVGNDPAGPSGKWLDVGPTGRVKMFDQALGTSTIAAAPIELVLAPGVATSALAVLDTNAATVRVQASDYDRTQAPNAAGKALFLDLAVAADAQVTVTITPAGAAASRRWDDGAAWMDEGVWRDSLAAGDGTVTVGTLLIGQLKGLGVTEASPTAGITDYSRKVVDDFGEVTVVPRAWAKRMAAKTLIRSNAVDLVAGRLAAVRARPCLWLGQEGVDSLTVYGFFKDFEITVGESVSKLSLSIEGLSTAGKVQPFGAGGPVDWTDLTDKTGTKPTDHADKTSENISKDTAAIGGTPTADFLTAYAAARGRQDVLEKEIIPSIDAAIGNAGERISAAQARADKAVADADAVDRRVDAFVAQGGYDDTDVRAEIRTVATVAANANQGVADLSTSVGASFRGVSDTLANYDERITTLATGSDSFASRASALEASSRADTAMLNGNGNFSDWPDARGTIPTGWGLASAAAGTSGRRVPGILGRYGLETGWAGSSSPANFFYAVSGLNFGDPYGGIDAGMFGGPGWYVMEADVTLVSGSLVGSDLYCAAYNADGNAQAIGYGHFPESSANGGGAPGAGQEGARYRFAILVDFNAPGTRSFRFHPMVVWESFVSSSPAKTLTWHKAGLRAATPQEIAARRADTNASSALARVGATEDALADLPNRYAAASRTAALEAQVNFAADSGLQRTINSRIEDRATVIADGKLGAANQRMDVMVSEYNGIGARVEQQAGTIAGLNGKAVAYVRFIADAGNGRASLSLWSDQYGGAWSLGGNGLIDGNLTITGTLTARTMDYGSVGEMSIYYDTTSLSFNSQSSWIDIATLALTSRQGQPIEGFFTCILTNLSNTSTQVLARVVRLEDGTPIWGGSGGILIAARDEGESMTASFFDSLGAGTTGTYAVQMKKKAGASNTVSAAYRSMRLVEMSRNKFQQIVINTPSGEGPGRGTYGGGSINGGGYGLGNFNLQ